MAANDFPPTSSDGIIPLDTNSAGDRVVAVENVQSVCCAVIGFDHNEDPPRAELGQAGHFLARYRLCLSLLGKTLLLGFILHGNEN